MFKEILQIEPKVSSSDLAKMEGALSKRFGSVAKKFGKGLVASLTGGGVAGLALGFIDKLLNPLKETQEAIDKVLASSDDIATYAKEFSTTAGKLYKLKLYAGAAGLDQGTLFQLISKFQTAVAEARVDPNKPSAVRNFTGYKDTGEGFFAFIRAIQKLDQTKRPLVENEVFGERIKGKATDFFGSDFDRVQKKYGGYSAEQLTTRINKLGDLKDYQDEGRELLEERDLFTKASRINKGMIDSQLAREALEQKRVNDQIASYQSLANISNAAEEIKNVVQKGLLTVADLAVKLTNLTSNVQKITESRALKGFFKWVGGN